MSTIITRNSATSGSIPSSLVQGELAINVTDGKLFYGSGSENVVKEFIGSASGGTINTGSFATTGSNIFIGNQTISGTLHQSGTFFPDQIDWFSSSIGYDTGSYILTTTANGLTTYANYQDVATIINSGLLTTSSFNSYTGSNDSQFAGTASYATNALTASYAISASYEINYETSSSYADFALSSSHAITASYALNATSASYAEYAATASSALNAQDILIRVLNQSGNPISKGIVVHITASGNSSDIPRVITASYENDNNSANTLGIANETIANGAEGFVMTEGVLRGIDTSAFTSGQLIYLGAAGSIIGTAPTAPLHAVRLGQVVRTQSNNGSIYVRIDNGYELDELHNVLINTSSVSYGDLLMYSSSLWINSKQLSGSYNITGSLQATSFTGSLFGSSSNALTASYVNPLNQNVIITGSLFLTGTGNNLFLITNQNNTPVFTVSQSGVIIIATQSTELTSPAPNGGIYFTSGAFYVGLD